MNAPHTEPSVDLDKISDQILRLDEEIDALETQLKQKRELYKVACDLMLKAFDLLSIQNIKMRGKLFYKTENTSVKIPRTLEDKEKLFNFLREKGLFEQIVSVNSQTLNSLYKSLAEEALQQGNLDFKIPGVEEPTIYTTLKLKKA